MNYSRINRQIMKIQSRLFQVHNRKRRESKYYAVLNLMFYRISRPLQQKLEFLTV
jgi:hypothetical protein